MPSVPKIDIAKETQTQLTELGSLTGFHIQKWMSNQAEDSASTIDLEENKLSTTKRLGVLWTADQDTFSFKYLLTPEIELTKQTVLKKTATIYDPLGFLAPFVIRAKILIQQAWVEAAGWDVPLAVHHQEQWRAWFQESTDLEGICIPRCLKNVNLQQSKLLFTRSWMLQKKHMPQRYTFAMSTKTNRPRHV